MTAENSIQRLFPTLISLVDEEELVEIASDLIAVPSFTGRETPLARLIGEFCIRNGITSFYQEVESDRYQTIGRLGPDHIKPALLLNGHLDMDPLGRDWASPEPYSAIRVDDKLYGPGVHNMKSGLTSILGAALAIQRSGLILRKPLLLEFVVGELQGGRGTQFALHSGLSADAAVIPEPYSVRRVITRSAGVHKFALVVRGITAHTSRSEEGVDAIRILRSALNELETTDLKLTDPAFPQLPRLQIGSIVAGRGESHDLSGISYCADKATALIDLRYPPPFNPSVVQQAIESAIARLQLLYPGAQITLEHPPDPQFGVGGTDMPPMDEPAESSLVNDIRQILPQVSDFHVEEVGVVLPYSYCGNDTAHLSQAGIECCLFGPRGLGEDTEKHVLVSEMTACARTIAALVAIRCT